ncbi:hypothetical protein UFOVP1071_25 [uncultured Caudovirales phage]|uniref:Uncharacterized protein n=1 Tax=uncultured Caudovirales phage TaxID=2100421 RepID=A0A6J5QK38_9CAUD|nr:hypothetical protein UFOVP1071_25 [uncultured Caudovirales phage]
MTDILYRNANNTLVRNTPTDVTLTLTSINGTFSPGDIVYQQDSSNTNATVVSFSSPSLVVSSANALFSTTDAFSAPLTNFTSGANAYITDTVVPPAIADLPTFNIRNTSVIVSGANTTNLAYVTTYAYDSVNVALTNTYINSTSTYTNSYISFLTSNSLTIGNSTFNTLLTSNSLFIGNSTVNALANSAQLIISNTNVTVSGANTTNLAYVTTYAYDVINLAFTNTYTNGTGTYTNTYSSVLTSNSLTIGNSVLTSNSLNMGNASINSLSNTTSVIISNKVVTTTGSNTSNLAYSSTYSYNVINLAFTNTYTNSTSTYTNTYVSLLNSNTLTINNTSNNILTLIANSVNIAFGNTTLVQSINVNSNSVTISTSEPNYLSSGATANTRTRTLVVNPDSISGNVTIANNTISNTTYFAINANGITVANSTVTFTFTPPTAAQKTAGNYFLAANGTWTLMNVP